MGAIAGFSRPGYGSCSRPRLRADGDRLDARAGIELPQQRGDVVVDRAPREEELLCDLGVATAGRKERQHLALAWGQAGRVLARRPARASRQAPGAERAEAPRCELGGGERSEFLRQPERSPAARSRRPPRSAPGPPRRATPTAPTRAAARSQAPATARENGPSVPAGASASRPASRRQNRSRAAPAASRRSRAASSISSVAGTTSSGRCSITATSARAAARSRWTSTSSGGTPTAVGFVEGGGGARVAASGAHECEHDERFVVRPGRFARILEDTVGQVCGLGPAAAVECVACGERERVDPPEILVVRDAILDCLRNVRLRERMMRSVETEPAEVVQRTGVLLGEAGRPRLRDGFEQSARPASGSCRSSIVPSATSAVVAVRGSSVRSAIARARSARSTPPSGSPLSHVAHRSVGIDERQLGAVVGSCSQPAASAIASSASLSSPRQLRYVLSSVRSRASWVEAPSALRLAIASRTTAIASSWSSAR